MSQQEQKRQLCLRTGERQEYIQGGILIYECRRQGNEFKEARYQITGRPRKNKYIVNNSKD